MLDQFPTGLVAVVSDSFDIYNACEKVWGEELREQVIQRGESGSILVIRPDSGEPSEVVMKVSLLIQVIKIYLDIYLQLSIIHVHI